MSVCVCVYECVRVCKFMQATECSQACPTKTPPPLISSPIWNTLIHRELSLSFSLPPYPSLCLSLLTHFSPFSLSLSPCIFGSYSQVRAESPNMWRVLASLLMPLLQHWGRWLIIRSPNRMVSPLLDLCLVWLLVFCEEKKKETVWLEQLCFFAAMTLYFVMCACASPLNSVS